MHRLAVILCRLYRRVDNTTKVFKTHDFAAREPAFRQLMPIQFAIGK